MKVREVCDELTKAMPLRGGAGSLRRLFASAFTPKGRVDVTDFGAFERRVMVDVPFGAHATGLMQRITDRALERGLHVVQLLDPLMPERIAHVLIPAHGLAFLTGVRKKDEPGEWLAADALFDPSGEPEHEQSFDRNACELLWQRAVEQLTAAKNLHDELERFYVQNMDFDSWQGVLDGLIQRMG